MHAHLRVAQRLPDLLHLVGRVAHYRDGAVHVKPTHECREKLLVGRRKLGEAERAAARAVRARIVHHARARLANPKGAELGQVAVVIRRTRVVARQRSELLKRMADRLAVGVRVELLESLQRALLQRLALIRPVKLLVYVGSRHLHTIHAPVCAPAPH
eukprot:3423319-Pleurochrysis_carterae.AAC.2